MLEFNKWTRRYKATGDSVYVLRRHRRIVAVPTGLAWVVASMSWTFRTGVEVGIAWAALAGLFAVAVAWMVQPPMVVGLDDSGLRFDGERARWDEVVSLELRNTFWGRRLLVVRAVDVELRNSSRSQRLLERLRGSKAPRLYQPRVPASLTDVIVAEMDARAGRTLSVNDAPSTRWASWRRPALVVRFAVVVAALGVLPVPGATFEKPAKAVPIGSRLRGAQARPGEFLLLAVSPGPAALSELVHSVPTSGSIDVSWHAPWKVATALEAGGTGAQRVLAERSAVGAASACTGRPVAVDGGAPSVERFRPPVGSTGVVKVGDLVVAVDDRPVRYIEDVYAAASAHYPGDQVRVEARSPAGAIHVARLPVRLGEGALGVGGLGLVSAPLQVGSPTPGGRVDLSSFDGPSAGLSSALGLVDAVGPGPVAGGRRIAVTGTIAPDGQVGPIGGLKYKAAAARRAGASVMVVPSTQVGFAERFAGPLKVVGARNLDDAIRGLGGRGCQTESK